MYENYAEAIEAIDGAAELMEAHLMQAIELTPGILRLAITGLEQARAWMAQSYDSEPSGLRGFVGTNDPTNAG